MFNKIKWYDALMATGLLIILLINAFVGQYIIQGILWIYETMIINSDIAITIGLTLIAVGFVGSKIASGTRTNKRYKALKHAKTSSAGKYITTQ